MTIVQGFVTLHRRKKKVGKKKKGKNSKVAKKKMGTATIVWSSTPNLARSFTKKKKRKTP